MSFLKSVLFGSEGNYNICGVRLKYKNGDPFLPSLRGAGMISDLANKCLSNNVFRLITQGYLHVTIHELGHALTCRLFTRENPRILIRTDQCTATTTHCFNTSRLLQWKLSAIDLAGPMSNVAFSICKLVAATTLKNHITLPGAMILGGGAIMWITGELTYAYCSVKNGHNSNDFNRIAKRDTTHLRIASIALVTQCALGVFATIWLLKYEKSY